MKLKAYVINLGNRTDRLANFTRVWDGLEFERVEGGDATRMPEWFRSGPAAWGCMKAHVDCLERVAVSGQASIIFEDDAEPAPGITIRDIEATLDLLPINWEAFYPGGQLLCPEKFRPQRIAKPGILVAWEVNRMHAYVVKPSGARTMLRHLDTGMVWPGRKHCDHRIGQLHRDRRLVAYVPERWMVLQCAGRSDIKPRHLDHRDGEPTLEKPSYWSDPVNYVPKQ